MGDSSLKTVSNIMLKSAYEKSPQMYLPFDILPSTYSDVRSNGNLSPIQQIQKMKRLFKADRIISDANEE